MLGVRIDATFDRSTKFMSTAELGATNERAIFERHLRISQSAAMIAHAPMIIMGNGLGALIGAIAILPTFGVFATLPLVLGCWLLLLPVMASWLKLRGRELPKGVSPRRIRRLVWHSGLLGLFWGACMCAYLRVVPFEVLAFLVMGCAFLAAGSAAALYVIPAASVAYSLPIFLAAIYLTGSRAQDSMLALTLLAALMAAGVGWMLSANWKNFRSTIELAADKAHLLVEAEAAMRSKNEFLETISHEVRTPLTSICGYAKLLASDAASFNAEQQRNLTFLLKSSQALMTLADDLVDISKLDAGQVALELAPLVPAELVQKAVTGVQGRASAKGLHFELSNSASASRRVLGDASRLYQVFANLLDNAVKFTDSGAVKVQASLEGDESRPELIVTVADTGVGVPLKAQELVFQRFSQIDGSTRRTRGGTGLGLAITRELLTLMGGSVSLRSDGFSGSTFTVKLKMRVADGSMGPERGLCGHEEPAQSARPESACRLLVVDDDAPIRVLIETIVSRAGWSVDCAPGAAEAIRACRCERYDAILMDIQMPEMDGMQAAAQIRRLELNASTPIIAVTGFISKGRVEQIRAAGIDDYLPKPIVADDLLAKIAHYCSVPMQPDSTAEK